MIRSKFYFAVCSLGVYEEQVFPQQFVVQHWLHTLYSSVKHVFHLMQWLRNSSFSIIANDMAFMERMNSMFPFVSIEFSISFKLSCHRCRHSKYNQTFVFKIINHCFPCSMFFHLVTFFLLFLSFVSLDHSNFSVSNEYTCQKRNSTLLFNVWMGVWRGVSAFIAFDFSAFFSAQQLF